VPVPGVQWSPKPTGCATSEQVANACPNRVSLRGKKHPFPNKETCMTSMVDSSVELQTTAESAPCPPPWFGEVVVMAAHLRKHNILIKLIG
jgi:hypothetical protein